MSSGKSAKKRGGNKSKRVVAILKSKPAVKSKVLANKELNSFLMLHVGEATDAYLRSLATKVPAQF